MDMMKKAVIFDLDGTLLYSLEDLGNSTNAALRRFHFPERSLEEVRGFVGNGVGRLIHRAVPEGTDPRIEEECLTYFRQYYKRHMREHTRPYDGIEHMLKELRRMGMRTGILSNKFHAAVCELRDEYFSDCIDEAQGEAPDVPRKPDPSGLIQLMKRMGAGPEETVYLGDSPEDVLTAYNAKVDFIGVTWGYRSLTQLQKAGMSSWIDHPEELADKIRQLS